jgi:hypothetical protein
VIVLTYEQDEKYLYRSAQVVGSKTVWLAPPEVSRFMLAHPPPPSSFSQIHNPAANTTNPSMSNTSKVDVFDSSSQTSSHPEAGANHNGVSSFWKDVVPQAMSATLNPGDLLYLPPGWWHAMRSETISFSVSMWF